MLLVLVGYIGSIVAANALTVWVGAVPVGFGAYAPAGALCAGLALSLRDALHERCGLRAVASAIVAGAALSALLGPGLAMASGCAFLVSELLDSLVYARLRTRGAVLALVGSNVVGAAVDSAVFLWLAFGSLDFLAGQMLAKVYITGGAAIVVGISSRCAAGQTCGGAPPGFERGSSGSP